MHNELTSIMIIINSGEMRLLTSLSFLRKSLVSVITQGYIMQKRLENGVNISRNMFCKCPFLRYYWSVWGPYVYVVSFVYQLCSVYYVVVCNASVSFVDVRWLSLCSFIYIYISYIYINRI